MGDVAKGIKNFKKGMGDEEATPETERRLKTSRKNRKITTGTPNSRCPDGVRRTV